MTTTSFAFGVDEIAVLVLVEYGFGIGGQKIHREMDAFELAAFDGQVPRFGRAGRQGTTASNSLSEFVGGIILPDLGIADDDDAFGLKLFDAAHDDFFLVELHVGNAIHQQATGTISAFENGDEMAGLVQLRGGASSPARGRTR